MKPNKHTAWGQDSGTLVDTELAERPYHPLPSTDPRSTSLAPGLWTPGRPVVSRGI